ncbi:phosphoglucosamine mutase [Halogranum rubrum]|uniref:Phosphoglucosamine mutase n=1 Tax=Halogranum rubrum TaxID=553466 RepID=A0A1I4IGE8_9EURY|nr:phosphoglucosamine mutase [Halogranum rubrum]
MSLFGTSGIRGPVGDEVTADLALAVGRAVVSEGAGTVVVGRDPRGSGEILADAAKAGVRECGGDVVDLGMVSTPTLARSIERHDADAGIVVTASHNPAPDNGLKLWNPSGQAFDTAQREAIESRILDEEFDLQAWDGIGEESTDVDGTDHHIADLVASMREEFDGEETPFDGLSVAVDVGNGAGGETADALTELGAHVHTLNAQPDGRFPARPSEPTAENCRALSAFVAESDADLGIAHDGDADRMRGATESGAFISGDTLLALFARAVVSEGDRVAAPLNVSLAVDDELEARGASLTRTRVGDVYVAERATESDVVFGGESSGAWIWPDETLCPDGPLAACKLAAIVARDGSLDALVDEIATYPLLRDNRELDDKYDVMARVEEAVTAAYDDDQVSTIDGVHVETEDGWFLVRASGTQPLVRVTAQARSEGEAEDLLATALDFLDDAQ